MTPLYVPLHKIANYMENDKASLEIKLLKSIYPYTDDLMK
jgi:hypothetical protein